MKIERDTGEAPPALRNRSLPVRWDLSGVFIESIQQMYWRAYQDLTGSRSWSQGGPSEIPYGEKLRWLDENRIFDEDDRNDILYVIQRIDSAYIEFISKKLERNSK